MSKPTCVIIGVGPGLGLSLVEQFAKHDFSVAMLARNKKKLEGYKNEFKAKGYETAPFGVDITKKEELVRTLLEVIKTYNSIDVLIFNPSVMTEAKPSEIKTDQLKNDLDISFHAAVNAAQAVLPQMKKQTTGTILFTGSAAALTPIPEIISLSISKVALRFYALALGNEFKNSAIYAGTITIKGTMEKGNHFDPALIAEKFWWMYQTKPLERELIYE